MFENVKQFKVGDRVKLHPACDMWARGAARYGTVRRIGRKLLAVELDLIPHRQYRVEPRDIMEIISD